MLRISDFSKLTGVPVKTIRYYQEIGLIMPAEIDSITGYRRFDEKNVEELLKIVYLKKMGFKLNEIKNFNDKTLDKKIKDLSKQVKRMKKAIRDISNLYKNEKGEYIMKNFINDEQLIGKWHLLGLCDSEDEIEKCEFYKSENFAINDIFILPNGEGYWVIGFWTKDYIFINDVPMKYYYKDDKLVIVFDWNRSGIAEYYAVYQNIDHKKYNIDEIEIKDNVDLPFEDDNVKGVWKTCGFVREIADFSPDKKYTSMLYNNLVLLENGETICIYKDGKANMQDFKWTKGFILNTEYKTASAYVIKEIDGKKYMFMEHKSGDYCFGGRKPYYYVFVKVN